MLRFDCWHELKERREGVWTDSTLLRWSKTDFTPMINRGKFQNFIFILSTMILILDFFRLFIFYFDLSIVHKPNSRDRLRVSFDEKKGNGSGTSQGGWPRVQHVSNACPCPTRIEHGLDACFAKSMLHRSQNPSFYNPRNSQSNWAIVISEE